MKKNMFIIVGLGSIGLELLKRTPKDIDIRCIDLSPDTEELAKTIRPDCEVFIGDATSRLVLEDAGVADADGLILTTTLEKINIEVASILKSHFEVKRVIAIGMTKTGIETLESLGVEVENIFTASAIAIRNNLEQTSRAAHAIGLGKDEILEVEVHPNSRLANRPLRTLTPLSWRIGIIYRDDNIIIPKRDVVLKPKDRVIILGEPAALKTISEILTFKFQRFPLEYGSTGVVYVYGNEKDKFFEEVNYLCSIFPLKRIIVLLSEKGTKQKDRIEQLIKKDTTAILEIRDSVQNPMDAIMTVVEHLKGDQGLIMLCKNALTAAFYPYRFDFRRRAFLASLMPKSVCPIILLNGTFPYEKACIPAVEQINLQHSLETSLEISSSLNNEVTALMVKPSKYIESEDGVLRFDERKKSINEISFMYKASVNINVLQGNPVKAVKAVLQDFNLMIVSAVSWKRARWHVPFLSPDVAWDIVRDAGVSTLILPHEEESL